MNFKLLNIKTMRFKLENNAKTGMEYKLQPSFGKLVNKVENNTYDVHLRFSMQNSEENISPYDIELEIVGRFSIDGGDEKSINEFLNVNVVAILFPYLRSILSSSMSAMMISPIVLPIVDANNLFN